MQLSLSTGCFYLMPLKTTFRLAAEAGFEAVELVMAPEIWLKGPKWVRRLAQDYGLTIATIHQSILQYTPAGAGPKRVLDAARTALALETAHVVTHGTWAHSWEDPKAVEWLEALTKAQRELEGSGTRLALENHGLRVPSDAQGVLGALENVFAFAQAHDLDITLDTCHAGSFNLDLIKAYETVRPRLADIHLCDIVTCSSRVTSPNWRYTCSQHRMAGQGELDLGPLLQRLQHDGYAGPVTMEISPFALKVWSPRQSRARLRQLVDFFRSEVDKVTEKTPKGAHYALQATHL